MIAAGFERLVTLGEISRESGCPRRTVFNRMMAMHAKDLAKGEGGWMFRAGRRWWLVNVTKMRANHPGAFMATHVPRAEFDALEERVRNVEIRSRETHNALAATRGKLREVDGRLKSLELPFMNPPARLAEGGG